MKLKHLFMFNIIFTIFFGITCSFFAGWVIRLYDLVPEEAAIWTTRLLGGTLLGYATLMWYGRKAAPVEARKAIALALLIMNFVGFFASLEIQLNGNMNVLGWSNPIMMGLLALGYVCYLFIKPGYS